MLAPSIAGVELPIQAIEVEVAENGYLPKRYVIVSAHFPQIPVSVCDVITDNLRPHFPNADVHFTVLDREGEVEVYVPADQNMSDLFSIASAVAVIKASWGGEEINPLLITIAGKPISVRVEFNSQSWITFWEDAI